MPCTGQFCGAWYCPWCGMVLYRTLQKSVPAINLYPAPRCLCTCGVCKPGDRTNIISNTAPTVLRHKSAIATNYIRVASVSPRFKVVKGRCKAPWPRGLPLRCQPRRGHQTHGRCAAAIKHVLSVASFKKCHPSCTGGNEAEANVRAVSAKKILEFALAMQNTVTC
eukprot:scaffold4510_cov183-Amphora_coffeaeformis.AAC.38